MADFAALRAGLAARAATITGLHAYAKIPGQVETPAVIASIGTGDFLTFDSSMGRGSDDVTLTLLLLVSAADDTTAQAALDPFLAGAGTSSLKAAIEADPTLGGTAHYAVVTAASDYGLHSVADIPYWGCRVNVTIGVAGT